MDWPLLKKGFAFKNDKKKSRKPPKCTKTEYELTPNLQTKLDNEMHSNKINKFPPNIRGYLKNSPPPPPNFNNLKDMLTFA